MLTPGLLPQAGEGSYAHPWLLFQRARGVLLEVPETALAKPVAHTDELCHAAETNGTHFGEL